MNRTARNQTMSLRDRKKNRIPSRPEAVSKDRIARIWETADGYLVANWENVLVTDEKFATAKEAWDYARAQGFEEIFWMEVEEC